MAEILRYPLNNIKDGDDYFKIQVIKYEAPGLELTGGFGLRTTEQALIQTGSIKRSLATIILPMPATIQDNNAASWTEGTMNPVQAVMASGGAGAVLSENFLKALGGAGVKAFQNLGAAINTGEGQQAAAAGAAAAAVQALTGQGDINQIVSRAQGVVFNQNVELLFNGVTMRPAFQFSFDMVPRSKKESIRIKDIIRTLKINMTPQKGNPSTSGGGGGGLFVKAPNVFKLEYMSGGKKHPFLHRFKPCALTQMNVNYNGSGQYATYPDATPVHMQMTLQFQELSPIYAEEYENTTEGKIGVGY